MQMVELPVVERPQRRLGRKRIRKKFRYIYKIFLKLPRPLVRRIHTVNGSITLTENRVYTHEVMTTGGDHLPFLPSFSDVVAFLDDLDEGMDNGWQPDELKITRTISKRLRCRSWEI